VVLAFLPPHVWPLAIAGGVGLFLWLWHLFAKSSEARKIVSEMTGEQSPDNVLDEVRQQARDALPAAEVEAANAVANLQQLRNVAGVDDASAE